MAASESTWPKREERGERTGQLRFGSGRSSCPLVGDAGDAVEAYLAVNHTKDEK